MKKDLRTLLIDYFVLFPWYKEWKDACNNRAKTINQKLNTVDPELWLTTRVEHSSKKQEAEWRLREHTWKDMVVKLRAEYKNQYFSQAQELLKSRIGSDFWENKPRLKEQIRINAGDISKEEWNKISIPGPATHIITDDVINPHHYTRFKITPREYIAANGLSWDAGNVIKYVSRHDGKNGTEDLRKAIRYIEFMIEQREGHNE